MICPSCHKEVSVEEKNIGALFTCPQCRSVYFLNFDGTPEYGDVEVPDPEYLKSLQNNITSSIHAPKKAPKDLNVNEVEAASAEVPPESQSWSLTSDTFSSDMNSDQSASFEESMQEHVPELKSDPELFQDQQLVESNVDFSHDSVGSLADVVQNIESFGNQNSDISKLSFDLSVSGIDNKQLMDFVIESLDDQRFGWVVDDFIPQIKKGYVQLKALSPVQAFVLSRRLYLTSLKLAWVQNVQ